MITKHEHQFHRFKNNSKLSFANNPRVQQPAHGNHDDPRASPSQLCTAVTGGFPADADEHECTKWIVDQMHRISICKCSTCPYSKGKFKGILFATFADSTSRDHVIDCICSNNVRFNSYSMWASGFTIAKSCRKQMSVQNKAFAHRIGMATIRIACRHREA